MEYLILMAINDNGISLEKVKENNNRIKTGDYDYLMTIEEAQALQIELKKALS